jgi:hypothetical protein
MTIDTDKLKALALAATPGKWFTENDERDNDDSEYWRIESEYGTICGDEGIWWPPDKGSNEGNAKWIAAACPATVLALIAEVERLRADAGRYRWMRDVGDQTWTPMARRVPDGAKGIDAAIDAVIAAKEPPCGP